LHLRKIAKPEALVDRAAMLFELFTVAVMSFFFAKLPIRQLAAQATGNPRVT